MTTSLLILSILIFFINGIWSDFTYKDVKKYLINKDVKLVNFYLGLNFQFIDEYRFIQIYLKNRPCSKSDRKLFQISCLQNIITFVLLFLWVFILLFTDIL